MFTMQDAPTKRHLLIGNVTVGLIGYDVAINQQLNAKNQNRSAAIDKIYAAVAEHNYIPPGKEALYRQALANEYDRLLKGEDFSTDTLIIRILGPGCVSCNNIQKMVIEIMGKLQIAADIFQVHDLDEIGRFGVLQTPALLINDQVKSAGNIPTSSQIEQWLKDAADNCCNKEKG